MKPGLQFLNKIEANYRGAMDPHKLFGIKLRFQATDSFSEQVSLLTTVDRHIVALGFDPIDFTGIKEIDAPRRLDYQTLKVILACLQLFQKSQNALIHTPVAIAHKLRLGTLPRDIEAFLVEWF